MPTEQGNSTKQKEQEGKMQDKWPKCARENQEKSARRTHLDHTLALNESNINSS